MRWIEQGASSQQADATRIQQGYNRDGAKIGQRARTEALLEQVKALRATAENLAARTMRSWRSCADWLT